MRFRELGTLAKRPGKRPGIAGTQRSLCQTRIRDGKLVVGAREKEKRPPMT
jgi:hypothetical protein